MLMEKLTAGDEAATLDGWVRWELQCLWADLEEAQRRATNGSWSIDCEDKAQRIVDATSLVGPVSWRTIGADSVVDGWFKAMNERIGIAKPDLPTDAELESTAAMVAEQRARTTGRSA